MKQLQEMKPAISATPLVIALWFPIFRIGWWPIFPLNLVRKILSKLQQRTRQHQEAGQPGAQAADLYERERGERLIEGLVLFFCALSLFTFIALAAWYYSCGSFPGWLRGLAYVLSGVGLLRVLETFLVQTNVLIFDAYSSAERGTLHSLRGYYRLVVLLIHNYLEALFWFAAVYLTVDIMWGSFGGAFQRSVLTAFYFSLFNLSSFGEALVDGIKPDGFITSLLVAYQAVFGLFMALLIIARFIALLPVSWTEDEREQSMLFSRESRVNPEGKH